MEGQKPLKAEGVREEGRRAGDGGAATPEAWKKALSSLQTRVSEAEGRVENARYP